jgi:hypothetical protein
VTQENGAFDDAVPCGATPPASDKRKPRPQKPQKSQKPEA